MGKVMVEIHLDIVVSSDFLAPVCTANKLPARFASLDHLGVEFAVEEASFEDSKSTRFVLTRYQYLSGNFAANIPCVDFVRLALTR